MSRRMPHRLMGGKDWRLPQGPEKPSLLSVHEKVQL